MRRIGAMSVTASLLLTATSGCGTMANCAGRENCFCFQPSRPPIPFGGVINDGSMVARAAHCEIRDVGAWGIGLATLIDMPLSLGADIITLPWTTYEYIRETQHPTDRYSGFLPLMVPTQTGQPNPAASPTAPVGIEAQPNLHKHE